MKLQLINFSLMFMMMINNGHYALGSGSGYQANEQSSKRFNNGNNNSPSSPANYKFEYGVDDGGAGPQFGHQEERNGQQTRGQYRVLLPDGRTQVVTYTADENGYKADVKYENGPNTSSNSGGYSSGGDNAGGGYENVGTAASSYGPPPKQTAAASNRGGYSGKGFDGGSTSFNGNRNSRSFVKLRRTVDGRMFNYAY